MSKLGGLVTMMTEINMIYIQYIQQSEFDVIRHSEYLLVNQQYSAQVTNLYMRVGIVCITSETIK